MKPFSRRSFLKSTTLVGGGLAALAPGFLSSEVFGSTFKKELPHYIPEVPFKNNLREGLSGIPLTIKGTVYKPDGKTPLTGATIEIWQNDKNGYFDTSQQSLYRGKVHTDNNGRYEFLSFVPGYYIENGVSKMKRVFFLVSAPGFTTQFSQLYFNFKNDSFIDSKHYNNSLLSKFNDLPHTVKLGGEYLTEYNHYLKGNIFLNPLSSENALDNAFRLFPNPTIGQTFLSFDKYNAGNTTVKVYDTTGKEVLQKQFTGELNKAKELQVSHLAGGAYTVKVFSEKLGSFNRNLIIAK